VNADRTTPTAASAPPTADHLAAVERWVLWLSAAVLLLTLPMGSPRSQLGALCGVGLALGNARALSVMGRYATRRAGGKPKLVLGILLGMFQVKLLILGLSIYLMMHYLPVSLPWLVAGLSLLPRAALLRALEHAFREAGAAVDGDSAQLDGVASAPAAPAAPAATERQGDLHTAKRAG
jgi:hypothetical protein